jgi:hypothetical protein
MVNFETEVKLGNNDAIELTLVHQAFIYESKDGGVSVDLDMSSDITNVKFLGIEIESGFKAFKQFRLNLKELGIDLDVLIMEKEKELMDKIENEKPDIQRAEEYWKQTLEGENRIAEPIDPKCEISIVVPAFNEDTERVMKLIESLKKQKDAVFEVIFVVNPLLEEEVKIINPMGLYEVEYIEQLREQLKVTVI